MTIYKNGAEGQTNGTAVTTANSSVSGDAFTLVGGSPVYDTTHASHGSYALKMPASATSLNVVFGAAHAPLGGTSYAARFYLYFTALPGVASTLWRTNAASSALLTRINITAGGLFTLQYNNGSTVTAWTSSVTVPINQWVRVEVYTVLGASGQVQAAFYAGDATTPLDAGGASGVTINSGPLVAATFGKYGSDTYVTDFWFDDLALDNEAAGFMGPYSEQLPTPAVTLGSTTNPTTVGATDGSQVVTWAAVGGAGSYDAYRAPGSSPAQEDFTLVASGVTSPYTFTGLAVGTYSFGIKARP